MNFCVEDYQEFEVLDEELENITYDGRDDQNKNVIKPQAKKPTTTYKTNQNINEMLRGTSRFAFEADLLELVFERDPLFDFTLPIRSRSPLTVNLLWDEIVSELKSKYPNLIIYKDIIKAMYKNLRNNYTRYKTLKDRTTPSGSEQKNIPEPKHIAQLRRLDGVFIKHKQKCSLDGETPEDSPSSDTIPSPLPVESINLDDDNAFPPPKRARTVSRSSVASTPPPSITDFLNPLNQLVANTNNRPPVVPPPLPDMEQLFGNQVTLFLRELDMEEKYTAQSFITNYMSEQECLLICGNGSDCFLQ